MRNMRVVDLLDLTHAVRAACVRFTKKHHSVDYDFHLQEDLTCMCLSASMVLKEKLYRCGFPLDKIRLINHEYFCGYGDHVWLEVDNWRSTWVIDLTLEQFDDRYPMIVERSLSVPDEYYSEYMDGIWREDEYFEVWPDTQRICLEDMEMILDMIA